MRDKLLRLYEKYNSCNKVLDNTISPFLIILCFVITIPLLKSYSVRWLFAFITIWIAVNMSFKSLQENFRIETKYIDQINKNQEMINELDTDIKKLNRLKFIKDKLDLEYKGGKNE